MRKKSKPDPETPDEQDIEQRALRLLAMREHAHRELALKLVRHGYPAEQVERVLERLEQQGLLSDERFIESYMESRWRKGFGPIRIGQELRQKGLESNLIDRYLAIVDEDWNERLRQVHDKKYGSTLPDDLQEKSRRARFLEYRGFAGDQIRLLLWQNI